MSPPIFPFDTWLQGMEQMSVVFNADMLRTQLLLSQAISDAVTAQPSSPADGDSYVIPAGATGAAWSSFDPDDIALFRDGAWYAFAPVLGVRLNVAGTEKVFTGSGGWVDFGSGGVGGGTWGSITGTLSDQTDLQAALDAKAGAFTELSDVPSVYGSFLSPVRVNLNQDGLSFGPLKVESPVVCSPTDDLSGSFLFFLDSETETNFLYPGLSFLVHGKIMVTGLIMDSSDQIISDSGLMADVNCSICIGWDPVGEIPVIKNALFDVVYADTALASVSFSASVGAEQAGPFGPYWPLEITLNPITGQRLVVKGLLKQEGFQ